MQEDEVIRRARIIANDPGFYVEARVGSDNFRGSCCRAVYDGARFNDQAQDVIRLFAEQIAADHPDERPDWRVGLRVKPKYRDSPLWRIGAVGVVVSVHKSGHQGIIDSDGVVEVSLAALLVTTGADAWVTA